MRAVVALLLLVGHFAQAEDVPWFGCKETKDCVLAHGTCSHPESVNSNFVKPFEEQASKVPCQKSGNFEVERKLVNPLCFKDRCRIVTRAATFVKKDIRACATDADCAIGITGCWQWISVNKKYLSKDKGQFGAPPLAKNDPFPACLQSIEPGPKPKAVCVTKMCERSEL